jgi:hypothetical protein
MTLEKDKEFHPDIYMVDGTPNTELEKHAIRLDEIEKILDSNAKALGMNLRILSMIRKTITNIIQRIDLLETKDE